MNIKVHFIGIGGIGVSALAQYYLAKGFEVSGSDLTETEITEMLKKKGAKILIGKNVKENLSDDTNLVIFSPAVKKDNPELKKAKILQCQILSYPEALGKLTKKYFTIAVSGAHGKSTTASMISLLLLKTGFNPTAILGTKLKEFGDSNFYMGGFSQKQFGAKILVIEADEYKSSFLSYYPNIIVLTNIEEEHLDYYGNLNNILESFREYIFHLPRDGYLVFNREDENIAQLDFSDAEFNKVSYSIQDREIKQLREVLKVPGLHNASDALAAFRIGKILGLEDNEILEALSAYKGAWRRFEIKELILADKKTILVSDYAHHPTEIKVTLEAAREKWPKKRIWVVFQPHQYQRTYFLFDKLVQVFKEAKIDKLILSPIYEAAGRENKEIFSKVSSKKLSNRIGKKSIFISDLKEIKNYLENNMQQDEVIIIMGAGDIYHLNKMLST
jgi:UDP-N-acetylmuramate--alanine ligase